LLVLVPAVRGFDVDCWLSWEDDKSVSVDRRVDSKGGAREDLTIGAIADFDFFRIDLGIISNEAAVTTAIDFHFDAYPLQPMQVLLGDWFLLAVR
jgi:hypothetical protein